MPPLRVLVPCCIIGISVDLGVLSLTDNKFAAVCFGVASIFLLTGIGEVIETLKTDKEKETEDES